jgi:GNAT superfamily N-acetyltransferase
MNIRPIDPSSSKEIELVASRMRLTLIEVLGQEKGESLYTDEWLQERVQFHLDPNKSTGQVFVAENSQGQVIGHFIARIENNESGERIGLGSTIYVVPEFRKQGVALSLLKTAEAWMMFHGMTEAVYYTATHNAKLISLYSKHGYKIANEAAEMVQLKKNLI